MSSPGRENDIALRALRSRMELERKSAARNLCSEMEILQIRLKQAMSDVEKGKTLNPHLIANAAMLTETIARWNMMLDLMPMVEQIK